MKKGILLCGHGSRTKTGTDAFKQLVEALQARYTDYEVDYGFLEFNHPVYEASIERMYQKGIREIYALPIILFAGSHAKNDIPYEMNTIQSYYSDLTIKMGKHLGVNSFLLELAQKRILEEESKHPVIDRKDVCLMVVGRGTTDTDANSDVHKLACMLGEGMGFGFTTVAYSGTAYPTVTKSLELTSKMEFKRTIAIPFFFFTGILLERIYTEIRTFNENSPNEYIYTDAFGSDELILKAFDERLDETINGTANMNCQLCKYRKQIVGLEDEVGKEQVGHHLGVKGVLFEEDEKVGQKSNVFTKIKKGLGI
ncbi:sirohydrochlorin chelatase [Tenacibaculum finnmarkense]|uniref:Cobalamin biosynthesis protein CbiX n=1 Tax=Tenacibaculum finnmarkense genomovar ulcerans TaxID=2781388 RepID=A0A2I2LDT7_9FLAO|nr:sirohydrochlorin chelatase [Tenacibaculum finnmarkense]ALU74683.1 cobalamin biosynthesis protein CbiX [Tenacibaculum dicentrarchi]MBE7634069.1 sirohydrochlorin chelatase [Tenacibaculum finnmarkense genomovar ulcerans]MBE7647737.1 sirohydrochlorin chelatase [Tenacibaculum finnmarkense genomovar ulcerans]MBE7697590.1 sirohydrochlorin chelatase [Tenacibaculum finnmarkense genomovar ulcerans]MCD8429825.1 sirohydrochlorin chelatase [Tenacibaculum finnmarkense genomovar ulcerans]